MFYSSPWGLKHQMFSVVSVVNMNTDFAEICRVGILETDSPVHFFFKF